MMKKLEVFIFSIFISISMAGQTQEAAHFAIELDPAPYILKGYSVSAKYSPAKTPKIAFMASIYQSDFPDGMMTKINKDFGWTDMKIKTSYAAFIEFYVNTDRKGFYFGPSVFLYNKSVEFELVKERTSFVSFYPNARAGYIWYPFKKINLYVNPWFNIGSEINLDHKNQIGVIEFEPNKLTYIVALHIGYSFQIGKQKTPD